MIFHRNSGSTRRKGRTLGWDDPSPLRNKIRQLLIEGKTPDQIKKLLAPHEILKPDGVFNMAIEERAKRQETFGSIEPIAENVVRLREEPPKRRWEDIAAMVFADARRWEDAQKLYDEARGQGAAQRHWTGRGRRPSESKGA